jgi:hypothetical protein
MTLHDVLRTIVRGDGVLLNSAEWVAEALAAINAHEAASQPRTAKDKNQKGASQ